MFYKSTRGGETNISAASAIVNGLANDNGLFVPDYIPTLSQEDFEFLGSCNYMDAAKMIFELFLTDFSLEQIDECVELAYYDTFDTAVVTPLINLNSNTKILELWHGPTCAFKDVALQALPYLLTTSMKITKEQKKVIILVATSGDTGKAALEGFKNVDGTSIIVLYPNVGVSAVQKQQMVTQDGNNVNVISINGNFDDAQNAVKSIFMDKALAEKLASQNKRLSSANSINWGRLLPQIVYYVYSSAQMAYSNKLKLGEKLNYVVPTGNFGNILACWYARAMGAPIGKLICASNANNVLTDFINTGKYDKKRKFHKTLSPSMDILISSNLERLLFELSGHDSALINSLMTQLSEHGSYSVPEKLLRKINEIFVAGSCDDNETQHAINEVWNKYSYVLDTHTAVAYSVCESYRKRSLDDALTVVVSTASPYKFPCGVYSAIAGELSVTDKNEYEILQLLEDYTGLEIPEPIADLESRKILHDMHCEAFDISKQIEAII